jgi:hypothetical protein
MVGKVYKTAKGKLIDIGSLLLSNENTRAVGNMGVNARGDQIDSKNQPISTRNEQVQKHYAKMHTGAVEDHPVYNSAAHASASADLNVDEELVESPEPIKENEEVSVPLVESPKPIEELGGGLASAIAKAKQLKQQVEKTPQQQRKEDAGVTRI